MRDGGRAWSPSRRLMQVTGSNVRNEHLVLCAPGCVGVDGASGFSCALEEEECCRWSCCDGTAGGAEIVRCSGLGLVGQARHK
jgi:hypothetical protein